MNAARFETTALSRFELQRRADGGDRDALRMSEREQLLPRLLALRHIAVALSTVLAAALTVAVFGWLVGILVAVLLSLLLAPATRLGWLVRLAGTLYRSHDSKLFDLLKTWRWLDYFRGFTEAPRDYVASSRAELYHIVERSAAVLTRDELLRFKASQAFDDQAVEDIMTPISVVDTARVDDSLGPLVLDDLHKTGHSRFPVIDGDAHHVVGILYLHDIINLKSAKPTVRDAMDPRVHYIHQNQSLEHALNGFLKSHRHLFVVVNDYRETVGILTLEDVLESLVGKKIVDEFDQYEDLRAVAESNPRKNNLPKGKTDI